MRVIRQIIGTLATGYILMFYSEWLFWARVRPEDSLSGWIGAWLLYSIMAYVTLSVIARFRVVSIWALFLVGAVFGWLTEGVIVQTAYELLPLSLSFTGLAWHALITIWVGFYAVNKALRSAVHTTVTVATVIGIAFGFWAISWWVEPDGGVTHPADFALFTFATTLLLIVAYWTYSRTIPGVFRPSRLADVLAAVLLLLYYIFVTIPAAGWAALILPVLLSGLFLTLRHNRRVEDRDSLLAGPGAAGKARNYLGLLALPLTAAAIYSAAYYLGLRWQTNWIVYMIATPAGFILLAVACIKVWRVKPGVEVAD